MKTSSKQIYQAVLELVKVGRVATVEAVAQVTCLPLGIVDYHLKQLVSSKRLKCSAGGVYEPVEAARSISVTTLHTGRVKLEIADVVLDLSPREAREIGLSMVGFTY